MAKPIERGSATNRWMRPVLIGAVLAAQSAVVALAWWAGVHNFISEVETDSAQRIAHATEGTAAGLAVALSRAGVDSLEAGSPGWERAQSIIERLDLPGGARASVVDEDGAIVCHPRLRASGRGRKLSPPSASIVGTAPLPRLNATVIVTAPSSASPGAQRAAAEWVSLRIALFGVVLLSLTGVGVLALISLHSSRLESMNRALAAQMTEQSEAVLRTRTGMIHGLAKLADYRDSDTGHHLDRICTFATMLAERMREQKPEHSDTIDNSFISDLRIAASLHDIGKVGVPDRVLLKPGKLTPEERVIMERHTIIGASTLEGIRRRTGDDPLLSMSIDIALRHHERWDGTGYPDRIAGTSIPLAARIVAVADVYDALTSERVYKPAMSHGRAIEIIRESSGTHFDPDVVAAFESLADEFDRSREAQRPVIRKA
ncbi:MAG: HD domain-containing phosphohydrolase, partial [Planctomycetota bacterium]